MKIDSLLEAEHQVNVQPLLTPDLIKLYKLYDKNGFDLRIVGGAVRDFLLGEEPKDIDLASNATPDQSMDMLKSQNIQVIETGLQHGTITAMMNGEGYEITTLRIDTKTFGRAAEVEFTQSWEEDAKRRDLTYNAMSLDLNGTLYDYFGGMDDLKAMKTQFVGNADQRIQEDYLRILRFFRFRGRKPEIVEIDKKTALAIKKNAKHLDTISGERIWLEVAKLLQGKHLIQILEEMQKLGVATQILLPTELANLANRAQEYTTNPIIILSTLLTDLEQVTQIDHRWKFSADEKRLLTFLVSWQNKGLDEKTAQDMMLQGTSKNHLAALFIARGQKSIAHRLYNWQKPIFPVTGNDLIDQGYKPGPEIGQILKYLKNEWMNSNYSLGKNDLLKLIG